MFSSSSSSSSSSFPRGVVKTGATKRNSLLLSLRGALSKRSRKEHPATKKSNKTSSLRAKRETERAFFSVVARCARAPEYGSAFFYDAGGDRFFFSFLSKYVSHQDFNYQLYNVLKVTFNSQTIRLRRQRYLPNDEPIVLRVDFYVQMRSISFTVLARITVDEIFGDAFERNVALADAKTRSFFSLLQNVREMEEHSTQHSEIGFALIVDRWIRENQLARLLERFCRKAVGEKVIDGVFVDER